MTVTVEKIKNMKRVQELLECTNLIRKESFDYAFDNKMLSSRALFDEPLTDYRKLETIAYEHAIEMATTTEELESCAISIEEHSLEYPDPDGWAEEVRTKAYGIEWYLKKQFNNPAYQEFLNFTNEMGIKNPLEELQLAMNC